MNFVKNIKFFRNLWNC